MKNSHVKAKPIPDQDLETMLTGTSANLFERSNSNKAFFSRILTARRIMSQWPQDLTGPCLAMVQIADQAEVRAVRPIGEKLVVGRGQGSDWALEDKQRRMSGRHFSIEKHGQALLLTDLDSTNGTRINENPNPIKSCFLQTGDFIHAGGKLFLLVSKDLDR